MTNLEIYTQAKLLVDNFNDLNQSLHVKINFFLQKNKNTIMALAQGIDEARLGILAKYGTLNQDTGSYDIPTENTAIVSSELQDLFTIEQEVPIRKVSIDAFPDDIQLTTGQMEAMLFMID